MSDDRALSRALLRRAIEDHGHRMALADFRTVLKTGLGADVVLMDDVSMLADDVIVVRVDGAPVDMMVAEESWEVDVDSALVTRTLLLVRCAPDAEVRPTT